MSARYHIDVRLPDDERPALINVELQLDRDLTGPEQTDLAKRIEAAWNDAVSGYDREPEATRGTFGDFVARRLQPILAPVIRSRPARKHNRKVTLSYDIDSLLQVPNIQGHGTRHLGQVIAGGAEWEHDANRQAMLASIDGSPVGMIDLTAGDKAGAERLIGALGPRALQTVVATSKLVYEKTKGMPINQVATLDVREVATALRKKPDRWRKIDPDTLRRIGADLRAASRIQTWGADGPWDPKRHSARSGWVAPILHITAVHIEQLSLDGEAIPYEFDVLLGRNWATAIKEQYDVMQIAPGFMELDPSTENQVIRLAWYYCTEFRYAMRKGRKKSPSSIPEIIRLARLEWDTNNLKRSLTRLDKAHHRLAELQIIGTFARTPAFGVEDDNRTGWPPRKVYEQGAYQVEPPAAILQAYDEQRQKALAERETGRKKA